MEISAYWETEKKYVTSIILGIFLEILSYWKENLFNIITNNMPTLKRN